MYRIKCAEVWGGIKNQDQDVCSAGVTASLYSSSCDGGKGGDIYYISVCQNDMLTRLAVADVVGHGEAVSEVSQWLYESLQARMNEPDPGVVLEDLNQIAVQRGLDAMTTAAVAGFYTADGKVHFAYAGHHPMLVWRCQDARWLPVAQPTPDDNTGGLPLGVMAETTYCQQELELGSGDRLLLYTDGVLEAPNASGQQFGKDRLHAVLREVASASLSEVKGAVLQAIRAHTGGTLAHDDVTLLAVEVA